jgi:imidazolonepropionase-like amidohydrolase
MGSVAGYRKAWIEAADYLARSEAAEAGEGEPPTRDLGLETLASVLRGDILVHTHCYRADEMATMLDVADEFGYRISAFHHAVEAYKIADLLAEQDVCAAVWADWWGFKMEAYDAVRENAALVHAAGGCAIIHSDSDEGIQRLNQEAAKVMASANRAGIPVAPEVAMTWLSRNAARALGIDDVTGTLEAGKMADVVVWSGDPFSVYTLADQVYIDGALVYDRGNSARQPVSDFTLGTTRTTGGQE